jgi:hypothetical protein
MRAISVTTDSGQTHFLHENVNIDCRPYASHYNNSRRFRHELLNKRHRVPVSLPLVTSVRRAIHSRMIPTLRLISSECHGGSLYHSYDPVSTPSACPILRQGRTTSTTTIVVNFLHPFLLSSFRFLAVIGSHPSSSCLRAAYCQT